MIELMIEVTGQIYLVVDLYANSRFQVSGKHSTSPKQTEFLTNACCVRSTYGGWTKWYLTEYTLWPAQSLASFVEGVLDCHRDVTAPLAIKGIKQGTR